MPTPETSITVEKTAVNQSRLDLAKESRLLREWLDFLDRAIDNNGGVIHAARQGLYGNYLLTLLDSDSQAAETFVGPCVSCGHNNYDSERKECKQRWMEGRMSVVCGCPCPKHNSLANAATAMRDKCVEKVREYLTDCRDEEMGIIQAIAAELSFLTLDRVKPGEV